MSFLIDYLIFLIKFNLKNKKNPQQRSNEYFQPIPIHHVQSSQSARERLFGQQHHQQNLAAAAAAAADLADQLNGNRKVALVKPELRENCERLNYFINV